MLTVTRYFQAVILVAASASFAVAQIACTAGCKEVLADSCNTCGANSNCRVYEKPHCRNLNKADTPTVAGYARCVSVSPRQTIKVYSQEDCIVEFGEPGWRWLRTMWDFQAQGGLALEVDDGNGPDPVVT